ncbi:dihydrolipoamide dehydrogenase of branched-chain alpha-keto acid dehydrogenase [Hydrogenimonas sp.]|nr:dihydrolipoamide dehydrogenase of branched-chain alpha-keto acid dehydrogenase [Hydrogenimonas sp.]
MDKTYDICFIGGGLNYAGAVVAAKAGLKTVLIEKEMVHLGGTCLHNGCIPSKLFLHAADTVLQSRRPLFKSASVLDMKALLSEKETIVTKATEAIRKQCGGVDLVEGEAKLVEPNRVEVGGDTLSAKSVVIGTGSRPFIPEGIVYDGKSVVTSDEILNLETLPKKIAVYGDGAIGLEMASFMAAAGVETELIWRHDRLLRKAHPVIGEALKAQMEDIGVKLMPNRSIEKASVTSRRGVHITFEDGSEHYAPLLLVATGRRAVTDVVATPEIEIGKRGIETDRYFETTLPGHYAIGDCNGKLQLAHAARAEVLNVTGKLLGKGVDALDLGRVVKFIHTLPMSYASVGSYGEGDSSSVMPMRGWPYAEICSADRGVVILYKDSDDFVTGGEILAPQAQELIAIVSMALAGEMDAKLCRETILAHPTFSEIVERAFYRL